MSDNVAIRERPILFSGPMVRAILEGRKTQTRRVIVPQPWEDVGTLRVGVYHPEIVVRGEYEPGPEEFGAWSEDGEFAVRCRYGKPGDRLWVRESGWQPKEPNELELREGADTWPKYVYDADEPLRPAFALAYYSEYGWKHKPSIHMPRWASRLTLEITDVRVERVQDISREDSVAEGARRFDDIPDPHPFGIGPRWSMETPTSTDQCLGNARFAFANTWNSINAKRGYGWDTNPWVWCLTFKVVQ